MLTEAVIEHILAGIPRLTIGVLGDLFLDRYLDIDAKLTEPSIETGLEAYQVVRVRSYPGAAGTVINNLLALGALRVHPLAVVGDDGEGYELGQALRKSPAVRVETIFSFPERRTPTYTKPMLCVAGASPRELNRLDIKNRSPLPAQAEQQVLDAVTALWPTLDVLLVLDQVSEANCGVVTERVRARLAELAGPSHRPIVVADSRERIGLFRDVCLKPNELEFRGATGDSDVSEAGLLRLAETCRRPVFCTRSDKGMQVADPATGTVQTAPCYPVTGPIDSVGAGDSSSAGLACALGGGANLLEAAAFGNLVASITIQQLGTTGTATPEQVRERWRDIKVR